MQFNLQRGKDYLVSRGWSGGLCDYLLQSTDRIPIRFFIVDDSGSMSRSDGHRKVPAGSGSTLVRCSRWQELTDSLRFHAGLAEALCAPTEFRLLNGAPPIVVGRGDDDGGNLRSLETVFDRSPGGGTPLCQHIREVTAQIKAIEPQLRANAQKAVVVVATDGESSDGNIADAMRPLEGMPVWVVIRLCTDEENIAEYWNSVDGQLEIEMDVIDDLVGEAKEIGRVNNWLTYGEPLQRLREWGVHMKEMDLIDEKPLTADQMRGVCALILGNGDINCFPHPEVDWKNFIAAVRDANVRVGETWDPVKQRTSHWIRTEKLASAYSKTSCCTIA